jgi:hypothetical protein
MWQILEKMLHKRTLQQLRQVFADVKHGKIWTGFMEIVLLLMSEK